jgi:hypothetical protein
MAKEKIKHGVWLAGLEVKKKSQLEILMIPIFGIILNMASRIDLKRLKYII